MKPARLFPALVLLAAAFALDRPELTPRPHGQKPMFPVLTHLEITGRPQPGGLATIQASVTAWVPGEDLAWKLEVPDGLEVVNGPTRWNGRLETGETRTFEITLLVPDGAPYEVTAVLVAPERPRARSASTVTFDLGTVDGPKGTEKLVSGEGVTYIQYQGTSIPR